MKETLHQHFFIRPWGKCPSLYAFINMVEVFVTIHEWWWCEQKGRKLPPSLAAPTSHNSRVLLPLLHTHMNALTQVRDEWWFQTAVHQRCSDKKNCLLCTSAVLRHPSCISHSLLYLLLQENLAKTYTYTVILEMIRSFSAALYDVALVLLHPSIIKP